MGVRVFSAARHLQMQKENFISRTADKRRPVLVVSASPGSIHVNGRDRLSQDDRSGAWQFLGRI